jgi:hypothetical protein
LRRPHNEKRHKAQHESRELSQSRLLRVDHGMFACQNPTRLAEWEIAEGRVIATQSTWHRQ